MATQLLDVERLSKRFGGFVALDEIDLSVAAGERIGLIGPNGSGKSTLVNCLCGTLVNEAGPVRFEGRLPRLLRFLHGLDDLQIQFLLAADLPFASRSDSFVPPVVLQPERFHVVAEVRLQDVH